MREKILALLSTLAVILVQGAILFRNGVFDKFGNLNFYDYAAFRDITVHLSLVNEILNRFPPTNFAAGGVALKNYHYFFDVFLSVFARFPIISFLDLYFRVTPVVLSVGLCAAIYFAALKLSKSRLAASLSIFFVVFANSFGPAVPFVADFFKWSHVTGSGNTFMMDNLLGMMVNPQGILSLIFFLSLFLLFERYEATKKTFWLFLIGFILAISFGTKAYGGILFAPAAILSGVFYIWKKRNFMPLVFIGLGIALMGAWVLYSINGGVAGLTFAPFWLLVDMMSDINRLNQSVFTLLPTNIFKAPGVVLFEFVVFLFGALGLRVFGWKEIKRKLTGGVVFLYATALASLFLPIFFNQSSKAYEVVQFFPYFWVTAGILFSVWIAKQKWPIVLIFILLFLAFDKQELDIRWTGSTERITIPAAEMAAVNYIRQNTDPNAIFLLAPSGFNANNLWFSALAARRTVYSGERFDQQIGIDTVALSQKVKDAFAGKKIDLKYDYIFVSQTLDGSSARISNQRNLQVVFSSNGAVLYKVL